MKRILLVLTVAIVMAAMLVAMTAPAFAAKNLEGKSGSCGEKGVSLLPLVGLDFQTFPTSGQGRGSQFHDCPETSPVSQ